MPDRVKRLTTSALGLLLVGVVGACGSTPQGDNTDPDQVDSVTAPELGACRLLGPDDVAQPSNATSTVPCDQEHTAQTFAVGDLPDELADGGYDDPGIGTFAYDTCGDQLQKFLGADESVVMRTTLTWAWFRPTEKAWDDGARWYRCDVVGGGEQSESYQALPATAEALLQGRPDDRWMTCVQGTSVTDAPRIPCSEEHDWRAVTTIKVGEPADDYPGDRLVETKTRNFCSDSVGAWLNYPVDYDYAFTWFHQAEWDAGNRRSICWAKTSE